MFGSILEFFCNEIKLSRLEEKERQVNWNRLWALKNLSKKKLKKLWKIFYKKLKIFLKHFQKKTYSKKNFLIFCIHQQPSFPVIKLYLSSLFIYSLTHALTTCLVFMMKKIFHHFLVECFDIENIFIES